MCCGHYTPPPYQSIPSPPITSLQPGHNSDQGPNNGTRGSKEPIGGTLIGGAVGGDRAIAAGSVGRLRGCGGVLAIIRARAEASAGAVRARRGTGAAGAAARNAALEIGGLAVVGAARAGATATAAAARSGARCAACGYVLLDLVGALRAVVVEAAARVSLARLVARERGRRTLRFPRSLRMFDLALPGV